MSIAEQNADLLRRGHAAFNAADIQAKNGQMVSGREHFVDLHNWDAFWA